MSYLKIDNQKYIRLTLNSQKKIDKKLNISYNIVGVLFNLLLIK